MSKSPKTIIVTSKSGLGYQLRQFKINQPLSRKNLIVLYLDLSSVAEDEDKYLVCYSCFKKKNSKKGSSQSKRLWAAR
jgi:hypothetical protein